MVTELPWPFGLVGLIRLFTVWVNVCRNLKKRSGKVLMFLPRSSAMDKGASHTKAAQERPYPSTGPFDRYQSLRGQQSHNPHCPPEALPRTQDLVTPNLSKSTHALPPSTHTPSLWITTSPLGNSNSIKAQRPLFLTPAPGPCFLTPAHITGPFSSHQHNC